MVPSERSSSARGYPMNFWQFRMTFGNPFVLLWCLCILSVVSFFVYFVGGFGNFFKSLSHTLFACDVFLYVGGLAWHLVILSFIPITAIFFATCIRYMSSWRRLLVVRHDFLATSACFWCFYFSMFLMFCQSRCRMTIEIWNNLKFMLGSYLIGRKTIYSTVYFVLYNATHIFTIYVSYLQILCDSSFFSDIWNKMTGEKRGKNLSKLFSTLSSKDFRWISAIKIPPYCSSILSI